MSDNPNMTRRSFFKLLGCAASAAALAGCASTGPSDRIRPTQERLYTAPHNTNIVLDQATQDYIRVGLQPFMQHAGLGHMDIIVNNERAPTPGRPALRIFVVDDNSINAYVRGTDNLDIYIHRGLIESSTNPYTPFFVILHELGHIEARDVANMQDRANRAGTRQLLATIGAITVAGAGALLSPENAAVFGRGAQAISGLTHQVQYNNLMAFSRTREGKADLFAIEVFKRAGIDLSGPIELMRCLDQNNGPRRQTNSNGTHPVIQFRVTMMQGANEGRPRVENSELTRLHNASQASLGSQGSGNQCAFTRAQSPSVQDQLDAQRESESTAPAPQIDLSDLNLRLN